MKINFIPLTNETEDKASCLGKQQKTKKKKKSTRGVIRTTDLTKSKHT